LKLLCRLTIIIIICRKRQIHRHRSTCGDVFSAQRRRKERSSSTMRVFRYRRKIMISAVSQVVLALSRHQRLSKLDKIFRENIGEIWCKALGCSQATMHQTLKLSRNLPMSKLQLKTTIDTCPSSAPLPTNWLRHIALSTTLLWEWQ
jgi:hypothetical protein